MKKRKMKSWFIEMINKICRALIRLIKTKRDKTKINNMRNERENNTIDPTVMKRIIREYCGQLYAHIRDTQMKWTESLKDKN